MTFDRRNASGKTLSHFLRDAEVNFLKEVVKALGKLNWAEAGRPMDFDVHPGVAPMLTFEGYDTSDHSVNGWVALIVHDVDVKVHMQVVHAMSGRKEDVIKMKTGEVTPDLVAKRLLAFMLGTR